MPTGRHTFKKTDLQRAILTTQASGLSVDRFEIDRDGRITVVTKKPDESPPETDVEDTQRF
jgi:hypothetical protein